MAEFSILLARHNCMQIEGLSFVVWVVFGLLIFFFSFFFFFNFLFAHGRLQYV